MMLNYTDTTVHEAAVAAAVKRPFKVRAFAKPLKGLQAFQKAFKIEGILNTLKNLFVSCYAREQKTREETNKGVGNEI